MNGDTVEAAVEALRAGGLVLLPTETVYGLAADASNPLAVAAIFEAKGRPRFNPLIAHVEDLPAAEAVAVFTANRFVDRGGGHYDADGELVLKGVRRPVVLPFTLAVSGGVARMQGSTTLDRTAFNVGSGRWSTPDEVAKAVTVVVDITARTSR